MGCAITYLTKARPTLSWDQALLLVNRFSATRRMEKSCIWCNTCTPKIRWLRVFKTNKNCCMSLRRLSLFLDFRLVNVRQLHSMQRKMQHQHLGKRWWCTQVFVLTFHESTDLALNTWAFSASSWPHAVHISWKNKSIPRMWTDFAKTPAIH